jgi:hypothetical protein
MEVARRLYLYVISAITLGMLVFALLSLVNIALEVLFGGNDFGIGLDPVAERRGRLAMMLATIGVALPVWLVHWTLAQRAALAAGPRAQAERRSAVRALYLAGVMFGLMVLIVITGREVTRFVLAFALGADSGSQLGRLGLAEGIGAILVAGGFWLYHANVAARDWRDGAFGSADWLPRTYRYLMAFVGLSVLLLGIVEVVGLAGDVLSNGLGGVIGSGPRPAALASSLGYVVVGGLVWAGHWFWSNRIARGENERGRSERTARNRYGYLVFVMWVMASLTLNELSTALSAVLSAALGETSPGVGQLGIGLLGAIVLALVFAGVWWAHRRFMFEEAGRLSPAYALGARRVDAYVIALLGLMSAGPGLAWLIGKAISVASSGSGTIIGGNSNAELAMYVAFTIVGSIAWLVAISVVSRWRASEPLSEASSTARRTYLLLAIAGSVLGGVAALVLVLNRLFGSVLGVSGPRNLVGELATPLGVLVIALLIAGLHYAWLRRDQREVAIARTNAQLEALATTAPALAPEPMPVPAPVAQRRLVVTAPAGTDLDAALATLRGALPEGLSLEEAD